MTSMDEIRQERLKKIALLRENNIDPYPATSSRTHSGAEFLAHFDGLAAKAAPEAVTLAGRIVSLRSHGKTSFIDIFDGSEKVQVFFSEEHVGADKFDLFTRVADTSDFLEFTGTAYVTKRGHKSLLAIDWRILAKSIQPVPDAWYGLKDEDERYRKRYLDILLDAPTADLIRKKSIFWNTFRSYLLERNFIEVETPVLENTTGGAEARPFVTHHNALDMDVYLRISAGELWQKRLLVAGLPKVFEIGRIFRNEGMSAEHLQDYTQLEFYEAFSDFNKGMEMIKELYQKVALATFGTTKFTAKGHTFDLADAWKTYDLVEIIKEHYDIDALDTGPDTLGKIHKTLEKADIDFDPKATDIGRGVDLLWKKIRKTLSGPGFLVGVPVYLEPLAKRSPSDPRTVERFQIILAGSEVGKGFSELNDPADQAERFAAQQKLRDAGNDEAQMADMEYVEALEYGMPPAFGFGISERLFSFLADKPVRETQIFPLMRPRE